jgi:hypothetical protein
LPRAARPLLRDPEDVEATWASRCSQTSLESSARHHNHVQKILLLKEKPFEITPDPRYLYLSESHREALAT